jgi:ubiquitin carboxyl-terminal hydrolase L5
MSDWCTIESDPGVFSELIRGIGVKGLAVEEIYSFDDIDLLESLKPIYGLIFLFKWNKDPEKRECLKYYDNELFFANQVITNACATQAILSVLLNLKDIDIGDELNNLKSFTAEMDPQMKGLAIGESEVIKKVHNSFARPEPFVISNDKKPKKEGDVYHFITYIPFKGKLYELDGLQEGPILLGDCTGENWFEAARDEITKRILKYATSEIRFNLLAIVASKKEQYEREIERINNLRGHLYKKIKEQGGFIDPELAEEADILIAQASDMIDEGHIPNDLEEVNGRLAGLTAEVQNFKDLHQEEVFKHKKYEEENNRRKHNYLPFIVEMMKIIAKKGKLKELVDAAKEKQQARAKAKEDKK